MNNEKRVFVGIRLSECDKRKIDSLALSMRRTRSDTLREIIRSFSDMVADGHIVIGDVVSRNAQ